MSAKKPFEVKQVKEDCIHAISFSLDSTRPDDYYEELAQSLKRLHIDGKILLDLLACNGMTSRRFFTVEFSGGQLLFNTMKVAKEETLAPSIRRMCARYYARKSGKLSDSVLSTPARRALSLERYFN